MSDAALLLIDLQNDYFPGGDMELSGAEDAVENARRILDRFRGQGRPVIHIQHVSRHPDAPFFRPGTPGMEIHRKVAPAPGETVYQKHYPNCFRKTPLLDHLQIGQITRLVVAGMMTHMCVDTTVRVAFDLGYAVTLVHDACATRDLFFNGETVPAHSVHNAFLSALNGMFVQAVGTDHFLAGE